MTKLKIHCLQHVAVEGLGCIANWIEDNGHELSKTCFYNGDILPSVDDFDCLVVLGGPMGVTCNEEYPWIMNERHFIKGVIESGKPILGICLGAQLIVAALEGRVYPGEQKEIGWFGVQLLDSDSILKGLHGKGVFHWHGETFDIPEGAVSLASSELTPNQAFLYNDKVLGLQFHLEVNDESIAGMVREFSEELQPSEFVQCASDLTSRTECLPSNNKIMFNILNRLFVG